jgi:hypothetical protein
VIWQELELEEDKERNREDHESDQGDQAKHEPHDACPHFRGSGKVLHEDIAR